MILTSTHSYTTTMPVTDLTLAMVEISWTLKASRPSASLLSTSSWSLYETRPAHYVPFPTGGTHAFLSIPQNLCILTRSTDPTTYTCGYRLLDDSFFPRRYAFQLETRSTSAGSPISLTLQRCYSTRPRSRDEFSDSSSCHFTLHLFLFWVGSYVTFGAHGGF